MRKSRQETSHDDTKLVHQDSEGLSYQKNDLKKPLIREIAEENPESSIKNTHVDEESYDADESFHNEEEDNEEEDMEEESAEGTTPYEEDLFDDIDDEGEEVNYDNPVMDDLFDDKSVLDDEEDH